jgi:hypothetical protein
MQHEDAEAVLDSTSQRVEEAVLEELALAADAADPFAHDLDGRLRRRVQEVATSSLYRATRRRPLVLPVILHL